MRRSHRSRKLTSRRFRRSVHRSPVDEPEGSKPGNVVATLKLRLRPLEPQVSRFVDPSCERKHTSDTEVIALDCAGACARYGEVVEDGAASKPSPDRYCLPLLAIAENWTRMGWSVSTKQRRPLEPWCRRSSSVQPLPAFRTVFRGSCPGKTSCLSRPMGWRRQRTHAVVSLQNTFARA